MAETVLAAVKVAPRKTEVREFPMPDPPPDAGVLQIEAAGICGADVGSYPRPSKHGLPHIMGHENVGRIAKIGRLAAQRWGLKEGDRVALEEYLPCGHCLYCQSGDFRMCYQTDIHNTPNAVRYGTTPITEPPALWGGFGQYLYLHPNSVFHRIPEHVPARHVAMCLPLGNGWQWAYTEGEVRPGKTVLIQGPGQQGLGCVIASREAGADTIIVAGLSSDARRLAIARKLGADYTVDVQQEDLRERVMDITAGRGVDVVIDVAAATAATVLPALDVLSKKRGTLVIAAGKMDQTIADFPLGLVKLKYLNVKGGRGHSFQAVEMALRTIASGKYPFDELASHQFDLTQVDEALLTAMGERQDGAIHISIVP